MKNLPIIVVRKAGVNDIPAIRAIAVKSWPATYSSILSPQQIDFMMHKMYSAQALQMDMAAGVNYLVAGTDEADAGFAAYSLGDTDECIGKLHKLYVATDMQGQSIGTMLMTEARDRLKELGMRVMELNVNRHNPARSYYERIGFTVYKEEDIDIGEGYYMNDYVMRLPLY